MKAVVVPAVNAPVGGQGGPDSRAGTEPGPDQDQGQRAVLHRRAHHARRDTDAVPADAGPRARGRDRGSRGPGSRPARSGDRVGVPWVQASCGRCEWCLRGQKMFCAESVGTGVNTQGSHAEYMLARADATVLLPEGLSYEQAAPIFCAGYTVYSGFRLAEPRPSDRVAVVGVGGLGHLGLAVLEGHRPPHDRGHAFQGQGEAAPRARRRRGGARRRRPEEGRRGRRHPGHQQLLRRGHRLHPGPAPGRPRGPHGRRRQAPDRAHLDHVGARAGSSARPRTTRPTSTRRCSSWPPGRSRSSPRRTALDEIVRAYDRVAEGKVRYRAVVLP